MNCLLVLLSSLVMFAVAAAGHAVYVPAGQVYWNQVFPNTPIPTAIKELLTPLAGSATGERVRISKPKMDVAKWYRAKATETQVHDNWNAPIFFLEKDLQPGNKMTWQFTQTTSSGATLFTWRREADSIPFTSAKFPDILSHFSIQPNSVEAEYLNQTLQVCEMPVMDGESKYCATSLQSMVEFSMATIGTHNNIQVVSTNVVDKKGSNINYSAKQQYTIVSSTGVGFIQTLKFEEPVVNLVVCHAQSYAYAVLYCHTLKEIKAYRVRMVGKDGTKVETVVVCHINTTNWNPENISFRLLHVKPGTVPVCHFLAQDSLVWAPKTN